MHIRLILFKSPLHDHNSVMAPREPLISGLEKIGKLTITESTEYTPTEADSESITISFIATGGTEEIFSQVADKLPDPIILLCDGYSNSMAATFEIGTWLSQRGKKFEMITIPADCTDFDFLSLKISCIQLKNVLGNMMSRHGSPQIEHRQPETDNILTGLYSKKEVSDYLKNSVVGLIGGESSWLISSQVDTEYIAEIFGTQFVKIDIGEVISDYLSLPDDILLETIPEGGRGCTREKAIKEALKMYKVLSDICSKYSLTALTVKCFDLLETCCTTSCLALAFLNDKGIPAGCEGDIPALWTMMVGYALSGKPSFMANPASSSAEERTIDFAHCSVPFSMAGSYSLPSHFESRIGVGIEGEIILGPCSIVKISGKRLDTLFCINGDIITNTKVPQRCRTQIRIHIDDKAGYDSFFSSRFGNHVIITPYTFNKQ